MLISSALLMGCTNTSTTTPTSSGIEQKQGDTTIAGTLTGGEGAFFIQVSGQQPQMVDSYSLDLSSYVGQTVTITGQYSGSTLFVGEIQ